MTLCIETIQFETGSSVIQFHYMLALSTAFAFQLNRELDRYMSLRGNASLYVILYRYNLELSR